MTPSSLYGLNRWSPLFVSGHVLTRRESYRLNTKSRWRKYFDTKQISEFQQWLLWSNIVVAFFFFFPPNDRKFFFLKKAKKTKGGAGGGHGQATTSRCVLWVPSHLTKLCYPFAIRSDEGVTLETSALKLFTAASLLSWWYQITSFYEWTTADRNTRIARGYSAAKLGCYD